MNTEKVVEVLSLLEWSGMGTLKASRPWCWRWQKAGHRGGCGLDALLSEARAEMEEYEDKEEGEMTKYVWVLILDYQAEPDWSVEGIFETEELAEKYRLYCEERDLNRLRIEKVALNRLRYMEGPEEEWMNRGVRCP